MATGTRKWWIIHTTAGVAAVLLAVFGVSQCSQKNEECAEKQGVENTLKRTRAALDSAEMRIANVNDVNKYLLADNQAKADTIKMQRDSIIVLNDSLNVVNGKLNDCRNSKKKTTSAKPKPQPKPQQPKPVAKPQPKDTVYVVVHNDKQSMQKNVNIELDNSQNSGNIVVGDKPCQSTEIVLKNGSVNNGNIVVGNNNSVIINNNVIADTVRQMEQAKAAYGFVRVKRVYRVK